MSAITHIGDEIRVNATIDSDQKAPSVTGLANGGWVVTWQSANQDGSGYGIYQQLFDKDGTPTFPSDLRINVTTAGDQTDPCVTALPDEGWLVTWTSFGQDVGWNGGIYQQRFDKNGVAQSASDILVNTTSTSYDQSQPSVTALDEGGWIVTWTSDGQDGSGTGIFQKRFDSLGNPMGPETRVNALMDGGQQRPSVTALTDGGWVVTWESHSTGPTGNTIYQQRYDKNGNASAVADLPVEDTAGDYKVITGTTALADGGWVVTWTSYSSGDIHQQRFDKNGTALFTTPRTVNVTTTDMQEPATIAALSDGGWLVVWQSASQDGSGSGIYLQVFDQNGDPQFASDQLVNTTTGGNQENPSVTVLPDGWIVTWQSADQDGSGYGIYQKRYFTNATPTDVVLSSNLINEDETGLVATLTAVDLNPGDTHTFTLTEDLSGKFEIIGNELRLKPGESLDYETASSHAVKITVTDQTGLSTTKNVTIAVRNVNDRPDVTIAGTGDDGALVVEENAASGTLVASLAGLDPEGDAVSFALLANGGGRFEIVGSEIRVAGGASLDYEAAGGTSHTVDVLVMDAKGAARIRTVTIGVIDGNDKPSDITLSATNVSEDAAAGDIVGTLVAMDQDAGDTFLYQLLDDAGGRFKLSDDGTQILVANAAALDYETATFHTIKVRAADGDGEAITKDIVIHLTDRNEKPFGIVLSNDRVEENSGGGATIGLLSGADPDTGDTLTYTIMDDPDSMFVIDGTALKLRPGAVLDAETKISHALTVQVMDKDGLTHDETFIVYVDGVNETPSDIALSNTVVDESAADGTVVGDLSVLDPDAVGSHIYTLVDSAGGRFCISDDGTKILVASGSRLDYETTPSHTIRVRVTDQGGLTTEKSFAITLNDRDEGPGNLPPTDILLSHNRIDENSNGGIVVGTLSASDPNTGNTFTYAIADDPGGKFHIAGNELQVRPGAVLDFESDTSHSVTIRVTDNTGLTFEKTFTIHIDDVGERPTDIALSGNTIREGVETETVVGFLSAADPDSGSTFIYTLEDDAGGRFMLGADGRSIVVADGARLDYETDAFHTITVRVSDGTYTFDKAFTITVEDLAEAIGNRAPTDIVLTGGAKGNATVDENAEAEVVVGSLAASDADTGDSFTYTLLDDAGGRFRLDESGAQILVADGNLIDYEVASSYTIRVQVSDGKGGVFSKNIAIGANDVNEKPTDITLSGTTVGEEAATNTFVGSLSVIDPDTSGTYTYTLIDNAGGRFKLSADGRNILVADGALLDYETATSHEIKVRVGNGGLTFDKTITISLDDLAETIPNRPPTDITLSGGAKGNATVDENAESGMVIGNLGAADPNLDDAFSFSLLNDAGGRFKIVDGQIVVRNGALLDYEAAHSHTIRVRVTDKGTLSFEKDLTINLNDIHEPVQPNDIVLTGAVAQELAAAGTTVGELSATDGNGAGRFTYTLLDNAGGRFRLDATGTQIQVADGTLLDYEQARSHTIRVRVTDEDGLSFEKNLTIAVSDVNPETASGSAANDILLGGMGADTISGNAGADTLAGGLGKDTLSGGAGQDVFVFDTKPDKANVDRILDFSVADDTIQLENAVFTKLKAGKLAKGAFWKGAKAHDKDDRIIYDSKKGYLYYDADGSGSKAKQVLIATLTKNLKMTHADFFVI